MTKKAKEWNLETEEQLKAKIKEYQFDSLVYRYMRAREAMAERDMIINKDKPNATHYQNEARRDIMRFIQILDEVMGEHK